MKKLGVFALTIALACSMTVPALATGTEAGLLIAPRPAAGYSTALTLNGEALDTAALPTVPAADLLPMRLIAENDYGSALWVPEEGVGYFYLNDNMISVTFATGEVTVNDTVAEGVTAVVKAGVTFLPASVVDGLEGYAVTERENGLEITTPNNDPMVRAAYRVMDASGMAYGMRADAETMMTMYQIPADQFEQVVAFFPMITSPDTVIIGKLNKGADSAAVKTALEAYRQNQEDTFSWYLPHNLPKVEDARLLMENGYVFFLIAENADAGVAAFRAFVASR